MMRWAVLDGDGKPVGPLHDTREEADKAVWFMNHFNPGNRRTAYRLGLLRIEEMAIPEVVST